MLSKPKIALDFCNAPHRMKYLSSTALSLGPIFSSGISSKYFHLLFSLYGLGPSKDIALTESSLIFFLLLLIIIHVKKKNVIALKKNKQGWKCHYLMTTDSYPLLPPAGGTEWAPHHQCCRPSPTTCKREHLQPGNAFDTFTKLRFFGERLPASTALGKVTLSRC